jgi:hypothetical protein
METFAPFLAAEDLAEFAGRWEQRMALWRWQGVCIPLARSRRADGAVIRPGRGSPGTCVKEPVHIAFVAIDGPPSGPMVDRGLKNRLRPSF